ncbi:hypothetical protein GCM10028809_67330 [Spirosoma gilvum]
MLLAVACTTGVAQTTDSTKIRKPKQIGYNPNSRRNGYENYTSSDAVTGAGQAPGAIVNTVDLRYEGLRGTPYFLPEWNKGQIETTGGQTYTDVLLKFDAFRQQLLLLRTLANGGAWPGRDSTIVDADQVKSFQFVADNGQLYRFRKLPEPVKADNGTLNEAYFQVLYEGKTSLLKRVEKRFKPADYKMPYSPGIRYDEFREYESYFLLRPDQTLTKVKLSKQELLNALSDKREALKAFSTDKKHALKTESDAIALLKQYDSL